MAAENTGWMAKAKAAAKRMVEFDNQPTTGSNAGDVTALDRELTTAQGAVGFDHVSQAILLGSGKREARSRAVIYQKYHYMMGDPIISTALRAHVTMALGADEQTGQSIYLDTLPDAEKDKKLSGIVDDIRSDILPLVNRICQQVAFNAAGYGDAYGRVYAAEGVGVQDVYCEELMLPPLVQPYCRGNRVVAYEVTSGKKFIERLTIKQVARAKMPRMLYNPQVRVIDKSMRATLIEDDLEKQPLMPDLVGGSFLDAAEEAYDRLSASITGLVGQRILNSIDETMVGVNMDGMTRPQAKAFMDSLRTMLRKSKEYAEESVKRGVPVTERRFHLMPTFNEKQLTAIQGFNGTSGAQSISVEDVMFHAKMLAGALGIDLSMLGFSDLLSGGLGDGGFFRTSVQAAERSLILRTAIAGFVNEVIDIHTFHKHGFVFPENARPYRVTFAASISSLDAERQSTQERAVNAGALMLGALDQLKNLGLDADAMGQFLEKVMRLDEEHAKGLAAALDKAKESADPNEGDGFGGGGGRKPRQLAGAPGGEKPGDDNGEEAE